MREPELRRRLEEEMARLPIVQYEFFSTDTLTFSPRVRHICETECPQYNTTWACPPAVGTVEACRARCLAYPNALLLVTMAEVEDAANLSCTLPTRAAHEEVTRQVCGVFCAAGVPHMALSTESCAICPQCAWPGAPCRHPDRMFPCVESHGILVTELAERFGLDFLAGANLVSWFSLILYRREDAPAPPSSP